MNSNEGNPAPISIIMYPKNKKKKRLESKIFTLLCWLFTFAVWIFFILIIINSLEKKKELKKEEELKKEKEKEEKEEKILKKFYKIFANYQRIKKFPVYSIVFSLIYIIYLIIEFCSPILKYLFNKEIEKTIVEKMESLFRKNPSIKLKSNIKHNNKYKTNSYKYNIKSSRDISGNFILNINGKNKKFVFLKLKLDIIFDNENTSIDYINKKGKFINDNNEEDQDCEIKEEIKIKEMNKYNMIKIYDDDSILVNFYIFILLTLLSFVEFYKIYLNYISIYEEFTIRKVISLINDLSQSQEYNKYNPDVKIMGRKFINYIVSLNNDSRNKKNENKGNYKTNNDNVDNANNNKINTDSETRRKANVDSDSKNPYIKNN